MKYVAGDLFTPDGFTNGYIGFTAKKILEVGKGVPPKKPHAKGLIVPTFINAHTHIGDSFIRFKYQDLPRTVNELVAPPDGVKHRLLRNASGNDILQGMRDALQHMRKSGISFFCDFRENGQEGILQLKEVLQGQKLGACILSRPKNLAYDKDELDVLLKNSDGIGVSSISDWEYEMLVQIARETKRRKKFFALHASEVERENIDQILDLKPDMLVHMVKASASDLLQVREAHIPIVLCPRSNAFFGLSPNISLMKKVGVELLLGTDNAMLHPPNLLDELRYLQRTSTKFTLTELLTMVTYTPRKVLNQDGSILVPNSQAGFIILDKTSLEPLYSSANIKEGIV